MSRMCQNPCFCTLKVPKTTFSHLTGSTKNPTGAGYVHFGFRPVLAVFDPKNDHFLDTFFDPFFRVGHSGSNPQIGGILYGQKSLLMEGLEAGMARWARPAKRGQKVGHFWTPSCVI